MAAPVLPDYAPVPRASLGPAVNDQGYYVGRVERTAAAPVIEKYTGVLGAVDVSTVPTAFSILESIRLDLGYRMDVHP
jgi:hypothetical protein